MRDILIDIASQEAALLIVEFTLVCFSILGGLALNKCRQLLGAKRVAQLRAALDPAVQRAIARAEANGLSGEQLVASAVAYLEQTMADTLRGLGADGFGVRERLRAELAAASAS
ncbi:hypothetical protein [Limimaricola hongkongensis]|uniref:hypothetical protein n=1 Tax=Limimaricola hongkongensis TaxID=278132 RepID=UPI0003651CD4|nr:hypothetical protein [Limimaricola hongkongensis]